LDRHEDVNKSNNDLLGTILATMTDKDEEQQKAFDSYQTKIKLKSLAQSSALT
jgi:hypothetical protein